MLCDERATISLDARWNAPLSGIASQYPAGQWMNAMKLQGVVRGGKVIHCLTGDVYITEKDDQP